MKPRTDFLLAVVALQTDFIDINQFVAACGACLLDHENSFVDFMTERGWIMDGDREHLEYILARKTPAKVESADQSDRRDHGVNETNEPNETVSLLPKGEGRYNHVELYATGGIGMVWRAHDRMLDRIVALKQIRPELRDKPEVSVRFLREAQITGQLEHPGIVPVYELVHDSPQGPYYTMRLVNGRTLTEAAKAFHTGRDNVDLKETELLHLLNAFIAACRTVAYAHSRGVVHRDLKGDNVIVGDFGEVAVLDWGLAKQEDSHDIEDDSSLTLHGQVLGTPAYMSPEQAAGDTRQINQLTDVYGLGAILYEILTGIPPFTGPVSGDALQLIQAGEIPAPSQRWPQVPSLLESVCMRALAKDPNQRFPSANELALAVEQWQELERRQTQFALEASEALYHSLVETIPMNVWRKDHEHRFTFANCGFCSATGRPRDELLGKTDFDLFPAPLAAKYRRDDERVMATGQTIDEIEEHVTGEGVKMVVRVAKLPIFDAHNKVIGTQGIFWDVSDRTRLEEELALAKEEIQRLRHRQGEDAE